MSFLDQYEAEQAAIRSQAVQAARATRMQYNKPAGPVAPVAPVASAAPAASGVSRVSQGLGLASRLMGSYGGGLVGSSLASGAGRILMGDDSGQAPFTLGGGLAGAIAGWKSPMVRAALSNPLTLGAAALFHSPDLGRGDIYAPNNSGAYSPEFLESLKRRSPTDYEAALQRNASGATGDTGATGAMTPTIPEKPDTMVRAKGLANELGVSNPSLEDISARYTENTGINPETKIYQTRDANGRPVYVGYGPQRTKQEQTIDDARSELTASRMIARANPQDPNAYGRAVRAEAKLAYAEDPTQAATVYGAPKTAGKAGKDSSESKLTTDAQKVDNINMQNARHISDAVLQDVPEKDDDPIVQRANNEIRMFVNDATTAAYSNTNRREPADAVAKAAKIAIQSLKPAVAAKGSILGFWKNKVPDSSPTEHVRILYDAMKEAAESDGTVNVYGVTMDAKDIRNLPKIKELYESMGYVQQKNKKKDLIFIRDKARDNYLGMGIGER